MAEGYVESRERSGYFSVELAAELLDRRATDRPSLRNKKQEAPTQPILYDFKLSTLDPAQFPLTVWRKLSQRSMNDPSLYSYGDPQGEAGLREELADYLRHARGVNCTAEQIVIGAGTQTLFSMLCQMLTVLGLKQIGFEQPGYQAVQFVSKHLGLQNIPIELDEEGLDVQQLWQSGVRAAYITPSHQYPTGIVMPIARRLKLLQWAEAVDGFIVEDDYDGEFRYRGKPVPSLQGLDRQGRHVVYIGTFSKVLLPGIRVGYMVLPPPLLNLYRTQLIHYEQTASRFHQRTLQLFMQEGEWERHIRRLRMVYQKKHARLLEALKTVMDARVKIVGQDAGLHLGIEVDSEQSAAELVRLALEQGVRVYDALAFSTGSAGRVNRILLGFAGMELSEIEPAVRRLHQAWQGVYR
ncbi:PLP-dependent aminotransferase family protein [Brevibacillus fulvus]